MGGLGQNCFGVPGVIIEMENQKRKKHQADLFSPEAIRSRLSAKKKLEAHIDSHVEFRRRVDFHAVGNLKEDEALAILSAKLTLNGLSVLKLAMNHVQCTYTMRCREFQGFPLRTVLIHKIVTACCSSRSLDSHSSFSLYLIGPLASGRTNRKATTSILTTDYPGIKGSPNNHPSGNGIEKLLYLSLRNIQLKVVTPKTAAEEIRGEWKPSGPAETTMISDNDLLLSISGDEDVNYRLYHIREANL